jgi:hypothetical protein
MKKKVQNVILLMLGMLIVPLLSSAETYYVSTSSLASDSYTAAQATNPETPWRTIQYAANMIPAGTHAKVLIAAGTYNEKVKILSRCNGTANSPTIFEGTGNVIIDAEEAGDGTDVIMWRSIFHLYRVENIIIKNLKVQHGCFYGFRAEECKNVTFTQCKTEYTNASGINITLTDKATVTNNDIQKACQWPGRIAGNAAQECITMAGVNDFTVAYNEIYNSNVEGEGGEGIDAKGGSYDGEIFNNHIHDIKEVGIYIDAWSNTVYNIRVYNNIIENCRAGLFIGNEAGGTTRNIYFYNNVIKNSTNCGISFRTTDPRVLKLIPIYRLV